MPGLLFTQHFCPQRPWITLPPWESSQQTSFACFFLRGLFSRSPAPPDCMPAECVQAAQLPRLDLDRGRVKTPGCRLGPAEAEGVSYRPMWILHGLWLSHSTSTCLACLRLWVCIPIPHDPLAQSQEQPPSTTQCGPKTNDNQTKHIPGPSFQRPPGCSNDSCVLTTVQNFTIL